MSRDFDSDDPITRIKLILILLVFAVWALLYWLFGHPSRTDWAAMGALFAWMILMNTLESMERGIRRGNEEVVEKLRHDMLAELKVIRQELRDDLRDVRDDIHEERPKALTKENAEKLRQELLDELRDIRSQLEDQLREVSTKEDMEGLRKELLGELRQVREEVQEAGRSGLGP